MEEDAVKRKFFALLVWYLWDETPRRAVARRWMELAMKRYGWPFESWLNLFDRSNPCTKTIH